ncbi:MULTISPECIES: hypothetical protein [Pseudomonas]|uniref:hypothetical protein n=1 Tax=Pseudomonas TaxID=286 RepID=UPI00257B3E61|nr:MULTISPECIES: hypothetical protein [Pseudomonas]
MAESNHIAFPSLPTPAAGAREKNYPYRIEAELQLALLLRQFGSAEPENDQMMYLDAREIRQVRARIRELAALLVNVIEQAREGG